MLTKDEIQSLLHSTEAYRVERTVFMGNMDKFCEAICVATLSFDVDDKTDNVS